jgi:hypothetical protein
MISPFRLAARISLALWLAACVHCVHGVHYTFLLKCGCGHHAVLRQRSNQMIGRINKHNMLIHSAIMTAFCIWSVDSMAFTTFDTRLWLVLFLASKVQSVKNTAAVFLQVSCCNASVHVASGWW